MAEERSKFDHNDTTLFLVYQHIKESGMKKIAKRLYNLALEAGLDLVDIEATCDTSLKSVIHNYCQFVHLPTKEQNQHETTSEVLMTTEKLVLRYLIRNSHLEVAQTFALKTGLKMDQTMNSDLESSWEDFIRNVTLSKSMDDLDGPHLKKRLNNGSIPAEFQDTDEVKFSTANTRGAGLVLSYKDFQYTKISAKLKNGVSFWLCRFNRKFKCKGYLHFKDGNVTTFKEHNHHPLFGKMEISTMGTSDTTVNYSKTRRKCDVLHFRGYEYVKQCRTVDGRVSWLCRQRKPKKCKGFVYTRNGQIDGYVREHSHLPINIQPAEKPDENKMVSPLFL